MKHDINGPGVGRLLSAMQDYASSVAEFVEGAVRPGRPPVLIDSQELVALAPARLRPLLEGELGSRQVAAVAVQVPDKFDARITTNWVASSFPASDQHDVLIVQNHRIHGLGEARLVEGGSPIRIVIVSRQDPSTRLTEAADRIASLREQEFDSDGFVVR